ncbi:Cytidine and deoxycytidylate deaminase zinc-binding region family protein [Tritrichomonas foetus]|uniref:Cytidine and deoxycytidylate deaminase zinc-binding region family protein n=1 Tax=Tritrichomonas foetus TaxID=1144522 RepID=A0A1J4JU51_9EUKA|nr:Cytidine and deoxycytidylate deaminase zinc-binding region family protein [Tritrichomonas foetus]|eukprot:OHT02000.1 Cytidine and deoxycytidylate deaminase zinc-binding region family protein [Tritrichomonas foetus]
MTRKHISEFDEESRKIHEDYMRKALKVADDAFNEREVAVGCIIIYNDEIVAFGGNKTNAENDATRHAELVSFDMLKKNHPSNYLDIIHNSTLYVTCEPCIMCASAIKMMGVPKVVYGCLNDRFGGCGSVFDIHTEKVMPKLPSYDCIYGVLEEEAVEMLRRFYGRPNPKTE